MKVFVYEDLYSGAIEVFDSLKKAKVYTAKMWKNKPKFEEDSEGNLHDTVSDYVLIHRKKVK